MVQDDLDSQNDQTTLRLNERLRREVLNAVPLRQQRKSSPFSPLRSHSVPSKPRPRPKSPVFGTSTKRPMQMTLGEPKSKENTWPQNAFRESDLETTEQLVEKLSEAYGSVFAGWQLLDTDARGFLSREQLRRSLIQEGFEGDFAGLWNEGLDSRGHGVITLVELDREAAQAMVELKELIGEYSGMREALIQFGFPGEVGQQDLIDFFSLINCKDPYMLAREFLPYGGVSLSAVDWFDNWNIASLPSAPEVSDFLQDSRGFTFREGENPINEGNGLYVPGMTQRALQYATERWRQRQDIEKKHAVDKSQDVGPLTMAIFMHHLSRRHGNLIRAWRREVDSSLCSIGWRLFVSTIRRLNYHGSLSDALQAVSAQHHGVVDLANFAPEEYSTLAHFRSWMAERFHSASEAFDTFDMRKVRRLPRQTFSSQVKSMGYEGNSNQIFDYLVLDIFSGATGQGDCHSLQKTDFLWIENIKVPGLARTQKSFLVVKDAHNAQSIFETLSSGRQSTRASTPTSCSARAAQFKEMGREKRAQLKRKRDFMRSADTIATTIPGFKEALIALYGNLVRAWRRMFDVSGKSTVGKMNFVRAMKENHYGGNFNEAWEELTRRCKDGRSDILTLSEFAPVESARLAEFRRCLIKKFDNCKSAFEHLDIGHTTRISKEIFIKEVKTQMDFRGDASSVFDYIASDISKCGIITVDEFVWLDKWQSRADLAVSHSASSTPRGSSMTIKTNFTRYDTVRNDQDSQDTRTALRQKLIDECTLLAGGVGRAWRKMLDPRGIGRLSWFEFVSGMKELNSTMNLPEVWMAIVPRSHRFMTLGHLDMELQEALLRLHGALSDPELPDEFSMFRGDSEDSQKIRIDYEEFERVLTELGLGSDAHITFEGLRHKPLNKEYMIEPGAFRFLRVWGSSCIAQGFGVAGVDISQKPGPQQSKGGDAVATLTTAQMDKMIRRELGLGQGAVARSSSAQSLGRRGSATPRRASSTPRPGSATHLQDKTVVASSSNEAAVHSWNPEEEVVHSWNPEEEKEEEEEDDEAF